MQLLLLKKSSLSGEVEFETVVFFTIKNILKEVKKKLILHLINLVVKTQISPKILLLNSL